MDAEGLADALDQHTQVARVRTHADPLPDRPSALGRRATDRVAADSIVNRLANRARTINLGDVDMRQLRHEHTRAEQTYWEQASSSGPGTPAGAATTPTGTTHPEQQYQVTGLPVPPGATRQRTAASWQPSCRRRLPWLSRASRNCPGRSRRSRSARGTCPHGSDAACVCGSRGSPSVCRVSVPA